MNQILNTSLKNNNSHKKAPNSTNFQKKKNFLNLQFILSSIAVLLLFSYFFYHKLLLLEQEHFSDLLKNNYNISKLYSQIKQLPSSDSIHKDSIIGIIKIPILNISYTIFSGLDDDLLKLSPCRFYGDFPNSSDINNPKNLCIAGHNYDNDKFFSKLINLKNNDKIIIIDNNNNDYNFSVFKIYEVKNDDLSPIYTNISDNFELTLVTCNNLNNNRIIIKAKIED